LALTFDSLQEALAGWETFRVTAEPVGGCDCGLEGPECGRYCAIERLAAALQSPGRLGLFHFQIIRVWARSRRQCCSTARRSNNDTG